MSVCAIEAVQPQHWEIPNLPNLLNCLVIGDCRQPGVLQQADVQRCRSILLVTSDERTNIAAAFAARSLNPQIRLVVRSAQENLNELLGQRLGNFVAFEPTQISAPSFALAALDGETQGFFTLDNHLLRVMTMQIRANHRWCDRRYLYELNTPVRRILSHTRAAPAGNHTFYAWQPDTKLQAGDRVTWIEVTEQARPFTQPEDEIKPKQHRWLRWLRWRHLQPWLHQFWKERNQVQRVALLSSLMMISLFLCGVLLFRWQYADLSWRDALNVSFILVLGGYDELFGEMPLSFAVPWWLQLFSIGATVAGTIFVGILYALLTERVLAARFQFLRRRPPVPKMGHIVLVGLGRVGQRVAEVLQELKQPIGGLGTLPLDGDVLPLMPLIVGNLRESLQKANLATAKSVIVVTDDEVNNLELGLMARSRNPTCSLVIRTADPQFAENIDRLLPDARVLGVYALAAEAFAGAAFGENILNLFRLHDQTMLVTEYQIEAGDTLNGFLLAEIAYGYGVVPILHQRHTYQSAVLMPPDEARLQVGDRLVVLATIAGLQRIEQGIRAPQRWLVRIEKALSPTAEFEGAGTIARISGCDIGLARTLMTLLPKTLPVPLYQHQALRLVRELGKNRVIAQVAAPD